jgi:hypothetical protein
MDFKKVLLILCFFVSLNTVAQKRLEFNRIISHSGTMSNIQTITLDTVPAGKTYKITSFIKSLSQVNMIFNNMIWGNGGGMINQNYSFPIWLKEGDILKVYCYGSSSSSNYTYHISGIEFNIVQ